MDFSVLMGLVTTGAGVLFGKSRKDGKASHDAWQTAAETYGLLHKPNSFWSGPKLSGPVSGNDLTVDVKNRNTASAATRFRLGMPSLNLGLRLRKKGFWNSLRPRTRIGDRAFDDQVVADTRNEFALREFLTPERRTAIQGFLSSFKGAVVTDDEISFTSRGYVKKSDEMLGAIDAMTHVATVLSKDIRPTSVAPGERIAVPDPPEQPTEPEVEAAVSPDSLTSQANSPGIEEFCATVFAPGVLSFTANQIFKASYEGERIVWTGTLESMTPYTFDFDFRPGRGIKAVLTILESKAVGSRNVQAVIGLPPDTEGLDNRIGQPVTFTGTLLKVDGLARKVLVADAGLTESAN